MKYSIEYIQFEHIHINRSLIKQIQLNF